MDSSKNGRWPSPFNKFSRVKVKGKKIFVQQVYGHKN